MGSRSSHLRTKVVALLVSLAALWTFAAWVTLRDGVNLLWVQTYDSHVYQPSKPLLLELQRERRLSVIYLADRDNRQRQELESIRDNVRSLAAEFTEKAGSFRARLASGDELEQRIDELVSGLDGLALTREAVDTGTTDRASAAQAFTDVLDSMFHVYDSLGRLDQPQLAKDSATLIDLYRARELLAQEDTLISGALAAGRMNLGEYTRFAHLVGARRFLTTDTTARLPDADRTRFERMAGGAAFAKLQALEDGVLQNGRSNTGLPLDPETWRGSVEPTLVELREVVDVGGKDVLARATPFAVGVIVRVLLAAGLGLIAVIASIVVSVTTARALVQQLERLRDAAWQLANDRLPSVVDRLGRGEKVDVAAEAPPLRFGTDEIGQVSKAFNAVQETAVRTAVEQAELRRAVRDIFLSLARRTQALLHRQLTLLDAMERREADPEDLEGLFRVDHLATRMRRNAENLIVLSGATAGRTWRRSVPMIDVIRGAVAEVEDYTRVTVLPIGPEGLVGRAVGDVIHLLAELIENALSFSPPHTTVQVGGEMVANGYVIEIEDRGLGMSAEDRAAANERIASHPEFRLTDGAAQLGLYVVSRLTERHDVRVHLKESAYGGTTAVILIPHTLVTEETGVDDPSGTQLAIRPAVAAIAGGGRDREAGGPPGARSLAVAQPNVVRPNMAPAQTASAQTAGSPPVTTAAPGPEESLVEPAASAGTPTTTPAASAGTPTTTPAASAGTPAAGLSNPPDEPDPASPASATGSDRLGWNSPTVPVPQHRPFVDVEVSYPAESAPGRSMADPLVGTSAGDPVGTPAGAPTGTAVESGGAVGDDTPANAAAASPASFTPSGLPVRVRQAPPPRRGDPTEDSTETDLPRPPEAVRRMVSSYQSGSRRGRSDAARLAESEGDPPGGTD